jgi:uncharacterized protein YjcR
MTVAFHEDVWADELTSTGLLELALGGTDSSKPVMVALSELRLNSSLVRYLRQYEGIDPSTDMEAASEATSQQYQPWSLERRLSESDIQTIITEFLSGMPKHELARRYSVSLSGIKSLLRRRGIRRDGRLDTSH